MCGSTAARGRRLYKSLLPDRPPAAERTSAHDSASSYGRCAQRKEESEHLGPLSETLLDLFGGAGHRLLLLAGLATATALSWRAWRRTGLPRAHHTWLGGAVLTATLAVWLVFELLARAVQLEPVLWVPPFDRALGVAMLLMLGWAFILPQGSHRRWRPALVACAAIAIITYSGWAPTWSAHFRAQPTLQSDPTGLLAVWDIAQLVLAVVVAAAVLVWVPHMPKVILAAIGALACGSLLEFVAPVTIAAPVWWRLGTVVAGTLLLAEAALGAVRAHEAGVHYRRGARSGATLGAGPALPAPSGGSDSTRTVQPDHVMDPSTTNAAAVADQAVRQMAGGLGARPAVVCLLTPAGELDVWAASGPGESSRSLSGFPLGESPTLVRALGGRSRELSSSRAAPDLDRLFRLMGISSSGAVLIEPIGRPTAVGLLIAGRVSGEWRPGDQAAMQALARHAVSLIDPEARIRGGAGDLADMLDQEVSTISRLASRLEGLTERLDRLESGSGESHGTAEVGPTSAASSQTAPSAGSDAHWTPDAATSPESPDLVSQPTPNRDSSSAPADTGADTGSSSADAGGRSSDPAGDQSSSEPAPEPPSQSVSDEARTARTTEHSSSAAEPEAGSATPSASDAQSADQAHGDAAVREIIADGLGEHSARYERALQRLPWGVILADSSDLVAFGNTAAAQLLHLDAVQPGEPFPSLFPDTGHVEVALHRLRQSASEEPSPVELLLESPRIRVDLEPLYDELTGYLGTVAVVHHRAAEAESVAGQLAPQLADALRAPMTSILGYSDLISRGGGLSDEQVGRYLHRIDANMERLQVMLANLLTVLEIDGASQPAATRALDVEAALQRAAQRARAQLEEKALSVSYHIDGPLPDVSADPAALDQILGNLLANAAHRSPQGGDVIVSADVRHDPRAGRSIVIEVRDRGAQLSGATKGVIEIDECGAGTVGLTVVRLLAERQGGRAWAETGPGGTRFMVRLPARRPG